MTFTIITLGCKVNTYESEMMMERLIQAGYQKVEKNADITIINTCTVTNMADKKSKKTIRHIQKTNSNTILIVAGCSSENKKEEYQTMGIDILLGNKDKSNIVNLLKEFQETKTPITKFYYTRNLPFEDMLIHRFTTHTRAFLKIQDGCNNFCSYCIIPYVRGTTRSKEMTKALQETEELVSHGHQEIVLTGIHTGSYGYEYDYDLTDLIHEMSKLEGLKRIRISSIEITELTEKFLKEFEKNPKICSHLHIPLQAGSNEILKKMNRKYDLAYFENKCKTLRAIRPNISITTDIIVGHPYETRELFEETLAFAKRIQFSKIHAFPYSKRENTPAAQMDYQVDETEKKKRNQELLKISSNLETAYAKQFIGKKVEVLIEETKENASFGHTDNYLYIKIPDTKCLPNEICLVTIIKIEDSYLIGQIL